MRCAIEIFNTYGNPSLIVIDNISRVEKIGTGARIYFNNEKSLTTNENYEILRNRVTQALHKEGI